MGSALGYYFHKGGPIQIRKGLRKRVARVTLLHELLHLVYEQSGTRRRVQRLLKKAERLEAGHPYSRAKLLSELEEAFIEGIDEPLYQVLKTNYGFDPHQRSQP